MRAHARLEVVGARGHGGVSTSSIAVLRSEQTLVLRPAHAKEPEPCVGKAAGVARVSLAAAAAGPLGGDDYALDVHVAAGATLVFSEVSATLLLPGARGGRSHMRIHVAVADGATCIWLGEPVIAAAGCDHQHDIRVDLAAGARFLLRDELLLGRCREDPGRLTQDLRVTRAGRVLFHQQLHLGPDARGWRGPAVTGGNKCVGTVLVVDPDWADQAPDTELLAPDAAWVPLAGPAVMVSALAADSLSVRRRLTQGIARLGAPWAPMENIRADAGGRTRARSAAPIA